MVAQPVRYEGSKQKGGGQTDWNQQKWGRSAGLGHSMDIGPASMKRGAAGCRQPRLTISSSAPLYGRPPTKMDRLAMKEAPEATSVRNTRHADDMWVELEDVHERVLGGADDADHDTVKLKALSSCAARRAEAGAQGAPQQTTFVLAEASTPTASQPL